MLKIRFTYFILPSCIANGYISFLLAVFYATRWFHLPFIPSACLLERRKRKNGAEKVREPHILHLHTNTNVNNLEANEKLHKTENSGREREKKKHHMNLENEYSTMSRQLLPLHKKPCEATKIPQHRTLRCREGERNGN